METRIVSLSEIKPNPNNPRIIKDDKFKKLVQSIKDFPEMREAREIVVNKDMIILGGNMRFRAMQEVGVQEAIVKIVDWSEEKQREFIIKDNIESGEWEWNILANEWEQDKLEEWGLDTQKDWAQEVVEDEAPAVSTEPAISKLGEIYHLGRHRVMCGDSTKIEDVERLMDGKKADMVFTDPPYGMFLNADFSSIKGTLGSIGATHGTRGKKYNNVIGDHDDFKPELITTIFDNFGYCDEIFLFGADYYAELIPNKNGGSWCVWDKRKASQEDAIGSEFELLWSKQKHKRRMLRHDWFGFLSSENTADARNRVHPTQKPLTLLVDVMKQWGKTGDNVVDVYGGSGSTLIACEQTDRTCYGMELDPKYVDVIRKRYAKFVYPDRWEKEWESLTPCIM